MAHRLVWLDEALGDVEAIAGFIAIDSMVYASTVVRRIYAAASELKDFPHRGRVVPEWNDESVREVFVHNYRLIYRIARDRVEILTCIHGARLLPSEPRQRPGAG